MIAIVTVLAEPLNYPGLIMLKRNVLKTFYH